MNDVEVATAFVDAVLAAMEPTGKSRFGQPEYKVVFKDESLAEVALTGLLRVAGFPVHVRSGVLQGYERDQDGGATGRYDVNKTCSFHAVCDEDEKRGHYPATRWLEQAVHLVVLGRTCRSEYELHQPLPREEAISTLAGAIERSRPLPPIQVTADGDLFGEHPSDNRCVVDLGGQWDRRAHTRDTDSLDDCCVGVHEHCGGWLNRNRATATMDALTCRVCHLRVLFPRDIKTLGDLRAYFAKKLGLEGAT